MPASDATMTSGAPSVPATHEQEAIVLWVGGDERETLLKSIRASGPLASLLVLELDQTYRTIPSIAGGFLLNSNAASTKRAGKSYTTTTKAAHPYWDQAASTSQQILSTPLTVFDNAREDPRLVKLSHHRMSHPASGVRHFDAGPMEHPDANSTGAQVPFKASGTGFSSSPDSIDRNSLLPDSDVGQQPSFHERPFSKGTGTGRTRWFRSSSAQQLLRPNEDLPAVVGDLYLHTNTRSGTTYIWILHPDEGWVPVKRGCDHPVQTAPRRRLRIRKDGDPSWVTIRSLISMQSRERHR
ncbi:hypothetical protein C8R48DRAFT_778108 [Suillus tomentosus]|nr:hypothetical protein C8R48DRAFT_778108 [Suillus tomentosus]